MVEGYCYGDGCYIGDTSHPPSFVYYDPPRTSDSTGFVLMKENGIYQIRYLFVNTSSNYLQNSSNKTMQACPAVEEGAQSAAVDSGSQSSACPGAPAQQVKVGASAVVCTRSEGVAVRTEPSTLGELITRLATGSALQVIGGPACANGYSWWQVRTLNGSTGWMAEGGDAEDPYFICPVE